MLIMKYLNNIKLSLVTAVFVCTGTVFTGCEDDLTISGSTDKLETVDGVYGYVRSAAGARELTPITLFGDKAGTGHLFFELTKAAEQDVTVTFKIDKDALEAYNEANNTSYEMYPVDKLSLANDGKITVKAGEKKSASMELNINAGGTIGTTYAVAVSATADGGATVSTNNQTYIYLVKPQPAYPVRGTARDVKTLCFVEVNNENILNCGEYTMAKDGTPFFDVVSIFAANINVDSKTGRAHIFCNDQVSFLLKNADQIIRPLQAKGIKVNMTILGNHDESGMSSLSKEAAEDFAKELKAYADIYGLDGFDFDDEYSNYSENPSPGFEERSSANYCRLIYECRKIMPDKLLGIYEYLLYDAPNGSVEGKSAGELVDYMCYGTYQRYAKGREENFTGLPKSKYGPYSLKINNEYNGGWSGFNQETIQDLKDAGYGLQVFYNPEPRIYSYDHYFTAVSKVLYNDEVEWTGKYYNRTDFTSIQGTKLAYESYLGEWAATSSNSLYIYIDEDNNPRWWDWSGSQKFNVRIEEKEAGKSYYIYGWGTYPEITEKYPLVAEYDAVKGYISIYPQVIHEGDAADPETWEVHWGTYAGSGANCYWRAYPQYANYAIEGSINLDGSFGLVGVGNRWGLDPYHEVDGTLVVPHMDVKYHITENYTLVKN